MKKEQTFLETFDNSGLAKVAVDALLDAGLVEDAKDGGGFGATDRLLVDILCLYAERNRQKSNSDSMSMTVT